MTHRFRVGWTVVASASVLACCGCVDREAMHRTLDAIKKGRALDSLPVMLNDESPFRYPSDLYAKRVQGNVMLRVRIDTTGAVKPESTVVLESSGYAPLDTAALLGARALRFRPAMLDGRALAVSLRVPVYFRHPQASPFPGDSVLHPRDAAATDTTRSPHRQP